MNIREIEKLLEKFYNGETSLEEEKTLKDFFSGKDVPRHLEDIKDQFRFATMASSQQMDEQDFDIKIMEMIDDKAIIPLPSSKRSLVMWISGIAASVIILVAIIIRVDFMPNKIQDTYSDPNVAYNEARKVLLFVSGKFNKGTDQLKPVAKFGERVDNLQKLARLDAGLEQTNHIEKVNNVFERFNN